MKISLMLIFFIVFLLFFGCSTPDQSGEKGVVPASDKSQITQSNDELKEIKTPHFVNSAPEHNEVFTLTPKKVIINTNFDLVSPSEINVFVNGKQVSRETKIAENRLAMFTPLGSDTGDGSYEVRYKTCWPDRSCHEGQFYFTVDGSTIKDYVNMTDKKEITIRMKKIMFEPVNIIISKGTTVTFINEDGFEHFVNSNPHPSHNFVESFNSRGLIEGNQYQYTFNEAGEVHYHCSAHTFEGMLGKIIVLDSNADNVNVGNAFDEISTKGSAEKIEEKVMKKEETEEIKTEAEETKYFIDFNNIRTPHFVSSTPSHEETVSTTPDKVTIKFNFNLMSNSKIMITHNGKLVSGDSAIINKLNLETPLTYDGNGIYKVDYSACWPDGSCHEGQFGFIVVSL